MPGRRLPAEASRRGQRAAGRRMPRSPSARAGPLGGIAIAPDAPRRGGMPPAAAAAAAAPRQRWPPPDVHAGGPAAACRRTAGLQTTRHRLTSGGVLSATEAPRHWTEAHARTAYLVPCILCVVRRQLQVLWPMYLRNWCLVPHASRRPAPASPAVPATPSTMRLNLLPKPLYLHNICQ